MSDGAIYYGTSRTPIDHTKNWKYTLNSTAALITKYIGKNKDVFVPRKIDGKPVILQNSANHYSGVFTNNKNITSVVFGEGVMIANDSMSNMFCWCDNLRNVSRIPDNVTNMSNAFRTCYNLRPISALPPNVTNMAYTFYSCNRAMGKSPEIPASVTNMFATFQYCGSLGTAPNIPENVTDLRITFAQCWALTTAPPELPNGLIFMNAAFQDCRWVKNFPDIPESVTSLERTFMGCVNLTSVSNIPANVTNMGSTFYSCYRLRTAPNIPANVTNMYMTFRNCTNLTGNIFIKSNRMNNTAMQNCFLNTTLAKNVYIPCVGLDATNNTWNAAFNAEYGINGKNGVTVFDINAYVG